MINLKFDIKTITPDKIKELLSEERYRTYFVLAAAAVLAVIYLFFAVIPKFSFLPKTARQIKDLRNNIDLVNNRINRLDALTKRLENLSAELETYSNGLPDQKGLPEFLEELSLIAKISGVKILSITPAKPDSVAGTEEKGKEYYLEVPIVITAQSGYHQLGSFISNLEESKRFVTIEDLRIKTNGRSPRKHDIKISLKTYVSDEQEKT